MTGLVFKILEIFLGLVLIIKHSLGLIGPGGSLGLVVPELDLQLVVFDLRVHCFFLVLKEYLEDVHDVVQGEQLLLFLSHNKSFYLVLLLSAQGRCYAVILGPKGLRSFRLAFRSLNHSDI